MSAIAVIPARGGSRRIPRKNVIDLAGRPMIGHTIQAALESECFSRVVVSTDDAEIAAIAREIGAEVPGLRPLSLADDQTPVSAATAYLLRELAEDGATYDLVCQLMANCPLRTAADVRLSLDAFQASDATAQISVTRFRFQSPWWAAQLDAGHHLEPLFSEAATARSQDLPALFCPTGAVWWARSGVLLEEETFHVDGRTGWEMSWINALDIDEPDELELARVLMSARLSGEL